MSGNIFDQMGYQPQQQVASPTDPGGLPSTQPGMLGVSPATWQNIAALGSGMVKAANQRTADGHLANGTGFAGGFAGGVAAFNQSANQQAQARANMGKTQQETQSLATQNQLTQMQLPIMRQYMQMMQDPAYQKMLASNLGFLGGGTGTGEAPAAPANFQAPTFSQQPPMGNTTTLANSQVPQGAALAPRVSKLEGPNNGMYQDGNSPAAGPGIHQGALDDVNKQLGTNYTLQDVASNRNVSQQVEGSYLNQLASRFPNRPDLQLAAYNYGQGNVAKAGGNVSQMPQSVQNYVQGGLGPNAMGTFDHSQSDALFNRAQALASVPPMMRNMMGGDQAVAALRQRAQDVFGMEMAGPKAGATSAADQAARLRYAGPIAQQEAAGHGAGTLPYAGPIAGAEASAKANVELQTAGQIARAKAIGEGVKPNMDRFGNIYQLDANGDPVYRGRGSEAKTLTTPSGIPYIGEAGGLGVGAPSNVDTSPGLGPRRLAAPLGGQSTAVPAASTPESAPAGPRADIPAGGLQAGLSPQQHAFQNEYGESLGKDFEETADQASASVQSNYLFDNMRRDAQTWDMGKFAPVEAEARAFLSAGAQLFNVKGPAVDALNQKLGDYQAFNKSSGQLLRAAVHDTSSRAAVQEYKLIGESLPMPTTSPQAFGQVADQWQGMNDWRIAKQKFMQNYRTHPEDFENDFNTQVPATSFMINRMTQTPEGQASLQGMVAKAAQTPEGKRDIARIYAHYNAVKKMGLFNDLPPIGAQQP